MQAIKYGRDILTDEGRVRQTPQVSVVEDPATHTSMLDLFHIHIHRSEPFVEEGYDVERKGKGPSASRNEGRGGREERWCKALALFPSF